MSVIMICKLNVIEYFFLRKLFLRLRMRFDNQVPNAYLQFVMHYSAI